MHDAGHQIWIAFGADLQSIVIEHMAFHQWSFTAWRVIALRMCAVMHRCHCGIYMVLLGTYVVL